MTAASRRRSAQKYIVLAVTGAVICAGIATAAAYKALTPAATVAPWPVAPAIPSGVTLIEPNRDYLHARVSVRNPALANERGNKLYVLDVDTLPDQSACVDACAATWGPFVAPADAMTFGDWSVITRTDGTRQWTYQHKPLYRPANNVDPAIADKAQDPGHQAFATEDRAPVALTDWHIALFEPEAVIATPLGIAIDNVADANGYGLVDANGMTLYAFDGDARKDGTACFAKDCDTHWKPLRASEMMQPVGDFSMVTRSDGTQQWAYKGEPLYTFDGDRVPGNAEGRNRAKNWHAAIIASYFMPPDVAIATRAHGRTLTTRDGKTLYARSPFIFQAGGFDIYNGFLRGYVRGQTLGTKGCDAACLETWHPFLAPADARPSGFWEIVTRADGARQWVYKGYALYTFGGDKNPGDVNGNNIFDLIHDDEGPYTNADAELGVGRGAAALFWHIAMP